MMEPPNENQESVPATTGRRSRWGMKALNFPSFSSRSRSTDSKDSDDRKEKREAARKRMQNKMSFWKRKSANITDYDPTYRVIYLGNVLTGWAKGDGCVDKPLSTLWRNHISSDKPDIIMKLTVVNSGLRAVTKEHGLTEYWANRITYSVAHPSYPRVFCWIYRHEARKMKQELRCHAVLCPREDKAKEMAANLQNRLHQECALVDFKKEKISRQNARLSLANSIHDNPSMPYRKLLLQAGTCNYKPPIERSKSAPKLTSIEEVEFEDEDGDDYEYGEEDGRYPVSHMNHPYAQAHELHHPHSSLHHLPGNHNHHQSADIHAVDTLKFRLHHENDDDDYNYNGRAGKDDNTPSRVPSLNGGVTLFLAEESDEDEITDYLGGNEAEVDSAQSSSPASQGRSSGSIHESTSTPSHEEHDDCHSLSDQSDPGGAVGLDHQGMGKIKVSDQDTISDESGYSEEPISGRDVTVVRVNGSSSESITMTAAINGVNGLTITATGVPTNNNSSLAVNNEHKLNINLNQSGEDYSAGVTITSHSIPVGQTPVRRNSADSYLFRGSDTNSSPPATTDSESLPSQLSHSPNSTDSASPRSQPSPVKTPSPNGRITDLSVKSVLLSEFSASDRLKYIDRSQIIPGKTPLVLNRQEFCINI